MNVENTAMQQTVTTPSTDVDNIDELYQRARKAFEEYQSWPQEKVDMVCQAVGWELSKPATAEKLARLAVDESGIGVFEDKFHKVQNKTRGTMRDQMGVRTCDLVEEDKAKGIRKFAKPYGVVANVVPCTNPESTVCCIGLSLLKTRNAMIVSPHPRTPGSSALTVEHIRKALKKVGAPERLRNILEGESVFNDGTGVVVFSIILGMLTSGEEFSVAGALGQFVLV